MWLSLVLCGLLSFDLASSADDGTNRIDKFDGYRISDHFHNQAVNETGVLILPQQIIDYLEMLEYADDVGVWPRKHFVKRSSENIEDCGIGTYERLIGTNSFEIEAPRGIRKNSWDRGKDILLGVGHQEERIVVPFTPYFPPEKCLSTLEKTMFDRLISQIQLQDGAREGEKNYEITDTAPSIYMREYIYSRNKTGGCKCSFHPTGLGCVCCFWWEYFQALFCAGISYNPGTLVLLVEFTVQDRLVLKIKRNCSQSALSKFFERFTKPACYEKSWKIFKVKLCTKLFGNVDINWNDTSKPSQINLCMQVTCYFLFFDFVLFQPPCWEMKFGGNSSDSKRRGIRGLNMAQLTYEAGQKQLKQPVKLMYAAENLKAIGKYLDDVAKAENAKTIQFLANATGKIMLIEGEDPKILKKGQPTKPVNWSPTVMSQLHYLVVLYTDPLPSPLNLDDEDHKALSDFPDFVDMIKAGISTRTYDPKYVNLRVQSALGKTCGGVALSPDKIMTICACIKYFYLYHKHHEKPKLKFQDPYVLESSDIYITFAERSFNADQMVYELVQNTDHFMSKSKCFDAIDKDDTASAYLVHMHPVVMPVTPDLNKFQKLTLVPWATVASRNPTPVEMTIIGLEKRKDMDIFGADGYEMDPLYEVVTVPYESCKATPFCARRFPWVKGPAEKVTLEKTVQCFCAQDKNFQLCDGVIGFPMIHKKGIVGLNALSMHCKDEGSMVVATFTADELKTLEEYTKGIGPTGRTPTKTTKSRHTRKTTKKRNSSPKVTTSSSWVTATIFSLLMACKH